MHDFIADLVEKNKNLMTAIHDLRAEMMEAQAATPQSATEPPATEPPVVAQKVADDEGDDGNWQFVVGHFLAIKDYTVFACKLDELIQECGMEDRIKTRVVYEEEAAE